MGATLLAFFFSSSQLTRFGEEAKEGVDDTQGKPGGQRDWVQVGARGQGRDVGGVAGCISGRARSEGSIQCEGEGGCG